MGARSFGLLGEAVVNGFTHIEVCLQKTSCSISIRKVYTHMKNFGPQQRPQMPRPMACRDIADMKRPRDQANRPTVNAW
jgi:hypothetical protein